jgi:hypothetical protein
MKIHEYQAKQILSRFDVQIPKGEVADNPSDALKIAENIGHRVVLKAQIHAGGRGKGGGIRIANNPQEAEQIAEEMIGMTLITHQTGPEGKIVKKILVEEALDIDKELYIGIVIDRTEEAPGDRKGGFRKPGTDLQGIYQSSYRFPEISGPQTRFSARTRRTDPKTSHQIHNELVHSVRSYRCFTCRDQSPVDHKTGKCISLGCKNEF